MRLFTVETEMIIPGIRVSREPLGLVTLPGADVIGFLDIPRSMNPAREPCEDRYPEILDERVFRAELTLVSNSLVSLEGILTVGESALVVGKPAGERHAGEALVLWRLPPDWYSLPSMSVEDTGPGNHEIVAAMAQVETARATALLIHMTPYSTCFAVTGGGQLAMLGLGGEVKALSWNGESLFFGKGPKT